MKRFISALALCTSLLVMLSFYLFPAAKAQENPLLTLLNLPAPPPPNPLVQISKSNRDPKFYRSSNPPADDAPIEDLLEYWQRQNQGIRDISYKPEPSEKSLDRILAEIDKDPDKLSSFLNILPENRRSVEFVKSKYDAMTSGDEEGRDQRSTVKNWLMRNSPYFSTELARLASGVRDSDDYLTNHRDLLALVRVDWDKARPIVDRLYNDPTQKVSNVLARWALYKHALDTDSLGDIERYREELKSIVEDRSLMPGQRDLALDALVIEKDWSGRDEWHVKLMEDETLVDLPRFTGLTTIISTSPEEKYIDKMIELLKSDNREVRSAAARNLVLKIEVRPDDIVRALLPWLENPKWLKDSARGRDQLVRHLQTVKIPESVLGLIAVLDEKETVQVSRNANMAANAMNAVANAMAAVANTATNAGAMNRPLALRTPGIPDPNTLRRNMVETYPLRSAAISALATQADMRAGPPIRRILPQLEEYERGTAVRAILTCHGFTVDEQVEALEMVAKSAVNADANVNAQYNPAESPAAARARQSLQAVLYRGRTQVSEEAEAPDEDEDVPMLAGGEDVATEVKNVLETYTLSAGSANAASNTSLPAKPFDATEMKLLLGSELVTIEDVGEDLVRAMVDRIAIHDKKDPLLAEMLRKVMLGWNGAALNALLLRDLKGGKIDPDSIVKLLAIRKELRGKQQPDVYDLRTGSPAALGISACILEDPADFEPILNGNSDDAKTAMLACSRLIRAALPVPKVIEILQSKNRLLAIAAERYLESEDSPQARAAVLSLYPNQARILGATTAFEVKGLSASPGKYLSDLFGTVSEYFAAGENAYTMFANSGEFAEIERRLQKEVVKDPELLGIYSYENNFVRIYKDRAMLSWEDDPARYRERALGKDEFENLKGFLAHHKVDQLPPFLSCTEECEAKQLLMLGRQGGRRVFVKASTMPEFFAGLETMFRDMKSQPAKLKYWAGNQLAGLEIVFADDDRDAKTIWKNGADLRVLINDKVKEKEVEKSFANRSGDADDEAESIDAGEAIVPNYNELWKLRQQHQYDSYSWFNLTGQQLGVPTTQPVAVPYIPIKDSFDAPSTFGQWKAKTATIEIRADSEGLYKIGAGKFTTIGTGNYSEPVVTSNGRWAVVTKYDEEDGVGLVRVNLATNREFKVVSEEYPVAKAVAFVASLNRILVTGFNDEEYHDHSDGGEYSAVDDGSGYYLLDPVTGAIQPTVGEVRPIAQQTFRGLQPGGLATDFWAAIPNGKKGTDIGVYNTRTFSFKATLTMPKISFDSMDMWIDAAEGKVYFVYEGHVLSAPLTPPKP